MKLQSKYFDMIRIHRPSEIKADTRAACAWPECKDFGTFPAPAGPQSKDRRFFCKSHITEYNRNYNFFEGMSDDDAEAYRRGAGVGHRPTWSLGARRARGHHNGDWQFHDPLEIMKENGIVDEPKRKGKRVSSGQSRALDVLDLDETADAKTVRQRYKELVKKYHPDANGGDRRFEERLHRVIKSYQFLKASGFC